MSTTVALGRQTQALGRNGLAKMAGVFVARQDDDLYVAPVTSQFRVGRAYLLVPTADVPEVVKALLRESGTVLHAEVHVRGGVVEVGRCSAGVKLAVIDHDNLEAEALKKAS